MLARICSGLAEWRPPAGPGRGANTTCPMPSSRMGRGRPRGDVDPASTNSVVGFVMDGRMPCPWMMAPDFVVFTQIQLTPR